jgi:hypothetical protein
VADKPKVVVEAPADVDVAGDAEKQDVQIPPPPDGRVIRVTFQYPEAIYDAEGADRLR